MRKEDIEKLLHSKEVKDLFIKLYTEEEYEKQKERYLKVLDSYLASFDTRDILFFSSPGRTEISGNHTDHNHGKVLGASINLDCIAAVSKNNDNKVNIISETFNQKFSIDLNDLEVSKNKAGTQELLKGILQGFLNKGYNIGGFDAYITSDVIASAGVSSSASFETLICKILNTLYNDNKIDVVSYAHISKFAENVYWDKQSGLLDQMCCAYGGLINIDFKNPDMPCIKKVDFDFSKTDFSLVIVQTGKGHADLSKDYSDIPNEMKAVAKYFDKEVLAEVSEDEFYLNIDKIRKVTGDRAIMRAIHFFNENKRVDNIVEALENGRYKEFFEYVKDSGNSSWKYLQNCYTNSEPQEQGISITLALTENFINRKKEGTCRVHGGGFAGVIMAILPNSLVKEYVKEIELLNKEDSAYIMRIRPLGSICINEEL